MRGKSNREKTESIASLEISRLCDVIKIHNAARDRGVEIFKQCGALKDVHVHHNTNSFFS